MRIKEITDLEVIQTALMLSTAAKQLVAALGEHNKNKPESRALIAIIKQFDANFSAWYHTD